MRRCTGVRFELAALESRRMLSVTLQTLYAFNSPGNNSGQVAVDASGNIYGATRNGGLTSDGTVFELPRGDTSPITLYTFTGNISDGSFPEQDVTVDQNGDIFGETNAAGQFGSGYYFELARGASAPTLLSTFYGSPASSFFGDGPILIDAMQNQYISTTRQVGVYPYSGGTSSISQISEDGSPGFYYSQPEFFGGLMLDHNCDLFGATFSGSYSLLSLFEIPAGSSTSVTLYSDDNSALTAPLGPLALDSTGDIYLLSAPAGPINQRGGVISVFPKNGNSFTTLATFNSSAGVISGLISDSNGDLFGTTSTGGASSDGSVFEIVHGSNTISTLYSFTNGLDGGGPNGVSFDAAGNLYGATESGGVNGDGTIFELSYVPDVSLTNGILKITGTPNNDSISVTDTAGVVIANLNGTPTKAFSGVTGILITGMAGNDTVDLSGMTIPSTVRGGAGDDSIVGGNASDLLRGGAGNDSIHGGPGNDTLIGGSGNNALFGGKGDNVIAAAPGENTLVAGNGSDTIFASNSANQGPDQITLKGHDSVIATAVDEILGADATDTVILV